MNMHQKIFAVIATLAAISLVVIVALAPRAANAQSFEPGPGGSGGGAGMPCGHHDKIVAMITGEKFKETRRAVGTTDGSNGTNFVEVFASKAGTWTILVSTPEGFTCIHGAGESWEDVPPEVEGSPS